MSFNKPTPPTTTHVTTSHNKGAAATHPVDATHTDKPMTDKAKADKLSADKTHGDKKHEGGHMPQGSKSER